MVFALLSLIVFISINCSQINGIKIELGSLVEFNDQEFADLAFIKHFCRQTKEFL